MSAVLYYYTARDENGHATRGSMAARTREAALGALRNRSLFVTSLDEQSSARGFFAGGLQLGVPLKLHAAFFRSLATLVRAGVPLRRALDVCVEQCAHGGFREALRAVAADVDAGLSLSSAFARRPREFSSVHTAMARAGEIGGVLDETLDRLASLLERRDSLRKRVLAALAYPAVVASAALCLMTFLLASVVPSFRTMYAQLHVALPQITVDLLALAHFVRSPVFRFIVVPAIIAALLCAAGLLKRARLGAFVLAVPVFGPMLRKAAAASFAQTMGAMLSAGVDLVAAIEVTQDLVPDGAFRESLVAIRREIGDGRPLSKPLAACGLYEPLFVQLVRVGEETGALDSMLLQLARYYETEIEAALGALGSVVEPAMIVLLGGAVAFIVAAIFIPLYTLIGSIK